jgi:hypothetical protein
MINDAPRTLDREEFLNHVEHDEELARDQAVRPGGAARSFVHRRAHPASGRRLGQGAGRDALQGHA